MSQYSLKKNEKFGFLQITPTPSAAEISKFYADEFYSGDYKKLNDSSLKVQVEDQDFYNGFRDDLFESMKPHLPTQVFAKLSILDIGCGWGQALIYFKQKGFQCYGFDPAPEAIEYAKKEGLTVQVAGLDKMNVFEKKFDVVILFNVLEHLQDPVRVVEEIKSSVLKPGGLLIIDVPNEFNDFQVVGQKVHELTEWWVAPPAHLNYFSKSTLCKLLEGTGYRVLDAQSSFPLEIFLLFGKKYVGDSKLGRECHLQRVQFELNLRKHGKQEKLRDFYRALAELGLGRQIVVIAKG